MRGGHKGYIRGPQLRDHRGDETDTVELSVYIRKRHSADVRETDGPDWQMNQCGCVSWNAGCVERWHCHVR
jgi:hypothetical protein